MICEKKWKILLLLIHIYIYQCWILIIIIFFLIFMLTYIHSYGERDYCNYF